MKKILFLIAIIIIGIAAYLFFFRAGDYIISGESTGTKLWVNAIDASPLWQAYFDCRKKDKNSRKPYLRISISKSRVGGRVPFTRFDVKVAEIQGKKGEISNQVFSGNMKIRGGKQFASAQARILGNVAKKLWENRLSADPDNTTKTLAGIQSKLSGDNAIIVLQLLGGADPKNAARAMTAVQNTFSSSSDIKIKLEALRAMLKLAPNCSYSGKMNKLVLSALSNSNNELRDFTIAHIAACGDGIISDLMRELKNSQKSAAEKAAILEALRKFGPKGKAVLPLLRQFTESISLILQCQAFLAYGDIGDKDRSILKYLHQTALDINKDKSVRSAAATSFLILYSPWDVHMRSGLNSVSSAGIGSYHSGGGGGSVPVMFAVNGKLLKNGKEFQRWKVVDMRLIISHLKGSIDSFKRIVVSHTESNRSYTGRGRRRIRISSISKTTRWTITPGKFSR